MEKHLTPLDMKPIFMALRTGIDETYISILENTHTGATTRVRMDRQVSEKIPVLRGVRQGDPISPNYSQQQFGRSFRCPARRKRNKYRWRTNVGPKICCCCSLDKKRYGKSVKHRERRKLKDWSQDT